MKTIVINQPCYFPWRGLFEQIYLSDIFVFFDDVQFSEGEFINRVQIKTQTGFKWLTIPLSNYRFKLKINEIIVNDNLDWKQTQKNFLIQNYNKTKFRKDLENIFDSVMAIKSNKLSAIIIESMIACVKYFGLDNERSFYTSSSLNENVIGTDKVLNIVKKLKANRLIVGMGTLRYFDFELFEKENIEIQIIKYENSVYPQYYEGFNPYVSILDLITNMGKSGINYFNSKGVYWRDFIKSEVAIEYLKNHSKKKR
jgi:hypothetical protein